MKTIFIVVSSRGIIMRNILRSGVLDCLKKADVKIIIFIAQVGPRVLPDYLKEEFEDDNVRVIGVPDSEIKSRIWNKIYRIFHKYTGKLVYNESSMIHSRITKSAFSAELEKAIYTRLRNFPPLKKITRFIEITLFTDGRYGQYFDQYKPDLVFSTSIISGIDIAFLKEARKRGIKTVSTPKGWDNISKFLYQILPDKFIVQTYFMKEWAAAEQLLDKSRIEICGFPQFDWCRRPEILLSREEYFAKIGLDPARKLIFFGSEGRDTPKDDDIAGALVVAVNSASALIKPCCLLIRPHFSDVKFKRFDRFIGTENVKVDDNFTLSDFFCDSIDPSTEEIKLFINTLYHCDISINIASTLSLDVCCFDKPIINIGYQSYFSPRTGEDVSHLLYKDSQYLEVLKTGAVDIAWNERELIDYINQYLTDPGRKRVERQALLDQLCYRVDGRSSERMADVILNMIDAKK